jgi:low affinity Fe/Cu permease
MERASEAVTRGAGSTPAFLAAFGIILLWLAVGPIFHFSDTWQLVINTATTIITFLMVFLIQRAQNKDARAVALKLNELIAATQGASNRLISLEELSEKELDTLHTHYRELVRMAKQDTSLLESHSVEEAATRHQSKTRPSR